MISTHIVPILLACTLTLAPAFARAECESEDAAKVAIAGIAADMDASGQRNKSAFGEPVRAFDAKATSLGWDDQKRSAFLVDLANDSAFQDYERQKRELGARVKEIQARLKSPEVNGDLVKACRVAVGLTPLVRGVEQVVAQEVAFFHARVEAAK